jgi:hypothetical protein
LVLHGSALSVLLLTIPHLPKVIHHKGWALHQPTGNHTPSGWAADNCVELTSQVAAVARTRKRTSRLIRALGKGPTRGVDPPIVTHSVGGA